MYILIECAGMREVFVSNLRWDIEESEVREFMCAAGVVEQVRLLYHPEQRFLGMA